MPSAPRSTSEEHATVTGPPSEDMAVVYDDERFGGEGFITDSQDALDEYTELEKESPHIMLGDKVSSKMNEYRGDYGVIAESVFTSDPHHGGFMLAPYASAETVDDLPDWYSRIYSDVSTGFAGVGLIDTPHNSIYHDPDQDVLTRIDNINLYGHTAYPEGLTDPVLNSFTYTSIDFAEAGVYGGAEYSSPWEYNALEAAALVEKFGFSIVGGETPGEATHYYLDVGFRELLEMIATGFAERHDVRKVTQRVNYNRNYEYLPDEEPREDLSIVSQVVKMADVMIATPDPAKAAADGEFERVIDGGVTPDLTITDTEKITALSSMIDKFSEESKILTGGGSETLTPPTSDTTGTATFDSGFMTGPPGGATPPITPFEPPGFDFGPGTTITGYAEAPTGGVPVGAGGMGGGGMGGGSTGGGGYG